MNKEWPQVHLYANAKYLDYWQCSDGLTFKHATPAHEHQDKLDQPFVYNNVFEDTGGYGAFVPQESKPGWLKALLGLDPASKGDTVVVTGSKEGDSVTIMNVEKFKPKPLHLTGLSPNLINKYLQPGWPKQIAPFVGAEHESKHVGGPDYWRSANGNQWHGVNFGINSSLLDKYSWPLWHSGPVYAWSCSDDTKFPAAHAQDATAFEQAVLHEETLLAATHKKEWPKPHGSNWQCSDGQCFLCEGNAQAWQYAIDHPEQVIWPISGDNGEWFICSNASTYQSSAGAHKHQAQIDEQKAPKPKPKAETQASEIDCTEMMPEGWQYMEPVPPDDDVPRVDIAYNLVLDSMDVHGVHGEMGVDWYSEGSNGKHDSSFVKLISQLQGQSSMERVKISLIRADDDTDKRRWFYAGYAKNAIEWARRTIPLKDTNDVA